MRQAYARAAVDGLAFEAWLRSGTVPDDLIELRRRSRSDPVEVKFNPNHDPATGRFTSAQGGAPGYTGITARGTTVIRPVGGGHTDRTGHALPELFPPDPYALRTPAEALAHYVSGSGEGRNFYFNNVDTSHVKLTDFPEIMKVISKGQLGIYPIVDATANYDGGMLGKVQNATSAATVGGMTLRADGAVVIARDGRYQFSGQLSAHQDTYDFNKRKGRTPMGDASTTFGSYLPGKSFKVNIIGSKPFSARGRR